MRSIARLCFVLASALTACARPGGAPGPSPSPAAALSLQTGLCHSVPVERAFCTSLRLGAPGATLRLAIADTADRRARGLMGTREIPAGEGMLFVFPEAGNAHHEFWMKDTVVPLDMVYIGTDEVVSAVFANVPASTKGAANAKIARRTGVGKYVIELRAGGAAAAGIRPGTQFDMPVTITQ